MSVVTPGYRVLAAPVPRPRDDDLLAVAEVTDLPDAGWFGGVATAGYPPGPAFVHDPCAAGSDRVKEQAGEIPIQEAGNFVVYLPASCTTVSVAGDLDGWIARLKAAFAVYERPAVEWVLATGGGMIDRFLGDANMELLASEAVDPTSGLRLLESAIAAHGTGIIHAAPSTVVTWDARNLTVLRGRLTYTKRGTPIAVGAGYANALPVEAGTTSTDEQWAFASGPLEIQRGELELPSQLLAEILDRTMNDVDVIAERAYVFNWIGRQDPDDDTHVQAGVLIDETPTLSSGGGDGGLEVIDV